MKYYVFLSYWLWLNYCSLYLRKHWKQIYLGESEYFIYSVVPCSLFIAPLFHWCCHIPLTKNICNFLELFFAFNEAKYFSENKHDCIIQPNNVKLSNCLASCFQRCMTWTKCQRWRLSFHDIALLFWT